MSLLAQINVATALDDLTSTTMADFVANLESINALAEASPGFIWRLKDESGDATDIHVSGDPRLIINVSVWQDLESLRAFAFQGEHANIMKRRKEWFKPNTEPYLALWWLEDGEPMPRAEAALARLKYLSRYGPSAKAFGWKDAGRFGG